MVFISFSHKDAHVAVLLRMSSTPTAPTNLMKTRIFKPKARGPISHHPHSNPPKNESFKSLTTFSY